MENKNFQTRGAHLLVLRDNKDERSSGDQWGQSGERGEILEPLERQKGGAPGSQARRSYIPGALW